MRPPLNTERRARKVGILNGKPVYRWPVLVTQEELTDDLDLARREITVDVLAPSASDAAYLVREEIAAQVSKPTQITVVGTKGGVAAHRFIGWESLIGARLFQERENRRQLALI